MENIADLNKELDQNYQDMKSGKVDINKGEKLTRALVARLKSAQISMVYHFKKGLQGNDEFIHPVGK